VGVPQNVSETIPLFAAAVIAYEQVLAMRFELGDGLATLRQLVVSDLERVLDQLKRKL
jgi:hypothetical protein